jgi:hypothetical protein
MTMRAMLTVGTFTCLLSVLPAVPATGADRLSDKDVKKLLDQVNNNRDRFEDQLDGKVKRSILRGPGGEVNVERYLDDLQENVKKLRERFTENYAASAEATTVLRQGSDIQRYMSQQPPNFQGASEWNRLASSLETLAGAYGTTFPMAEGTSARRINDRELSLAAKEIAKGADEYKKALRSSLEKDKSIDKATREASLGEVESLKRDAKALASRLESGDPASGEAKELLQQLAAVRTASADRQLSPAAQSAWTSIRGAAEKVAQGFGMPASVP